MLNGKLEIIINEFLDGELAKEKENYLFSELSSNDEARQYFKNLNSIKAMSSQSMENFPSALDQKVLESLKTQSYNSIFTRLKINRFSFVAYTVVLFLLSLGYLLFDQYNYQREQLQFANQQMVKQEKLIQLIMNNQLPPVTVQPEYENEIVIKATL